MKTSFLRPLVAGLAGAATALNLTVSTSNGRITGHTAPEAEGVYEFLGIPFAQPPLGDLRFAPPAGLSPAVSSAAPFVADKFVSFLWPVERALRGDLC